MIFLEKIKPILFTLFISLLMLHFFHSCKKNEKKEDLTFNDFYYPFNQWTEGMVYEYQPVQKNQFPNEYWYFRKLKTDTALYFTGQYFDHTFTPRQIFNAKIKENVALINDYILYEYDSLRNVIQKPAQILAGNSFPFGKLDSTSTFLLKLKWDNPIPDYPDGYFEMTRTRQYIGNAAYSFKNQSYDCLTFHLSEHVDDFNDGHLEKEYQGQELYAKNLGLIYYKKEIDENFVLEYELKDTFSMSKMEQKFKTYLSEDDQQ